MNYNETINIYLKEILENKISPVSSGKLIEMIEDIIKDKTWELVEKKTWFDFLKYTRKSDFLLSLNSAENRNRWAAIALKVIQTTEFSLRDMFEQRVAEHPKLILFQDMSGDLRQEWSYEQSYRHVREIAAVIHSQCPENPRVAIYSDNSIESACCDIACLCYDIFDTPLSIHFNKEILISCFEKLNINTVIVDSKERLKRLIEIKRETSLNFNIFTTIQDITTIDEAKFLGSECKHLNLTEIENILQKRKIKHLNQVATTMFTSGSTGLPKGVSFSVYNLISKRFARSAALPDVGNNEKLLCFLPLFHTFGRFLEMLGSIYWSATYVFVGNPSSETLLNLFPKVNPTGFISIPLRWLNLYEKSVEEIGIQTNPEIINKIIRGVIGNQLKWGLSAAGYLDPKVFRFFHEHGVELCSGFGMTEATGGITMTPPGNYRENSVGIPLPGTQLRLKENSELEISGHYIAKYLEDAGPDDIIPFPESSELDHWISTGDIFKKTEDNFYEIIDRVKDIYKNNKGQTIAPQVIEKKFTSVPGIKRTFLVGDGRPYNVLLIIPGYEESFLVETSLDNQQEYYHQIVMAANKDVAPFERVVNFAVLDRDLSVEKEELTPKGTFNRKTIEKNFESLINSLYVSNTSVLQNKEITVHIPRWFYRDLGILETDISLSDDGLFNRRNKKLLEIHRLPDHHYLIGDLEYINKAEIIDLGLFARQPRLWIGNPALINFSPIKDGWDTSYTDVSERVFYPKSKSTGFYLTNFPIIKGINNQQLILLNNLISTALFSEPALAVSAIKQSGELFSEFEPRISDLIRRRLEALATHPEEKIRVLAYRTLLLDNSNSDYSKLFPAFVQSGLSFLNEDSIREIASHNIGKRQLESLRQRMYTYRIQLKWPVDTVTRNSFKNVLNLLFNFACSDPEYFFSVRAELASWILHQSDRELSETAKDYFYKLTELFHKQMEEKLQRLNKDFWKTKLVFEAVISEKEEERLIQIFESTIFLQLSVILTFHELDFNIMDVEDRGIWITKLQTYKDFRHYRISINTKAAKHYDLHLVVAQNTEQKPNPETVYWQLAIANYAYDLPTLPEVGCSFPDLGILSTQYLSGLTVWDKIREFSDFHKSAGQLLKESTWRKLFIKAFTTFFKAWRVSGFQIAPGAISANNVAVPEMDFRENANIISLTGWKSCETALSIIEPMVQDFYCKTSALYPWSKKQLEVSWIFDSIIEALGIDKGKEIFQQLLLELEKTPIMYYNDRFLSDDLKDYIKNVNIRYYFPLALFNAVDQYKEWELINPISTSEAKEQTIFELFELYKLYRFPEIVRYYFYRNTYFVEAPAIIKEVFDRLLLKMNENVTANPIQLIELSDLQTTFDNQDDKRVFTKMVFPKINKEQKIDLMKIGESKQEHLIVRSYLQDKKNAIYIFREPLNPSEVGQLYQLFYKENYPKEISKNDRHFVITDLQSTVIGGLCYKEIENNAVLLDGSVITSPLQGNGLGTAMIEDFFTRMSNEGIKIIKAHFLFGNYYLKHNFKVDKRWGALVKYLE